MKKRLLSLALVAVMLLSVLVPVLPEVRAEKQKTKAISVVFDNSGSMYMSDRGDYSGNDEMTKAWCRATYAMEVFASMLNEGDVMQIHPMNPAYLNTEGTGTAYVYGTSPLVINGPQDAAKIRDLFLIVADGGAYTPLDSITAAYESLKKMNADEKYLVVLTDGAQFYRSANSMAMSESETISVLTSTLGNIKDVQVMYLGMGPANKPGGEDATHIYATAKDTKKVLSELTKMCNTIFGRDALPSVTDKMDIDVSMKKVIVFAQGKGADNVTLGSFQSQSQVKVAPSQRGIDPNNVGESYDPIPYGGVVDNDLGGVIATFGAIPAGSYPVSVGGSYDAIEIYYEPDVRLQLQFTDEAGNAVNPQDCYAGTYTLSWYMVDNQTGQITDSSLLGTPKYDIDLQLTDVNGNAKPVPAAQGNQVQLELVAGDNLSGSFLVTYLDRYTSESSMEDLGWGINGLTIGARPVGEVKLSVTGGKDTYQLSTFEQDAVYEISYYCQGEPIIGADLERAETPSVTLEGGNAKYDVQKTDTGWKVTLKYNGEAADTTCGAQKVTFGGSYTNVDGQTGQAAPVTKAFTLEDDSHGLKVELKTEDPYFVLYELDSADPVTAKLTIEGMDLDAAQFAATTVKIQIDGMQENVHYTVTPDAATSSYVIRFNPDADIDTADYTIRVQAQGKDEFGRDITAQHTLDISFNSIPLWLKILLWVLAIALIIFLIWAYMNMKVLPKEIRAGKGTFTVEGDLVTGSIRCFLSGGGKKRGTLEVQSPTAMGQPQAKCGYRLELEAISPRRTKSASRRVRVVGITPLSTTNTVSLVIGAWRMAKDPVTNKLVKVGGKPDTPVSFNIGNNCQTTVSAEVLDMINGGEIACTLVLPLKFF